MAELHVQPKRNKLWWLWILIVLVILALVYFYFRGNNNQMAESGAQVFKAESGATEVCASVRVNRTNIYSKAIVKLIKEVRPVPVKLFYL